MPTNRVKGNESYEVEYRIPGDAAERQIQFGLLEERQAPNNERPQACFHVLGGGLDFNTEAFPIPTPQGWLDSDK